MKYRTLFYLSLAIIAGGVCSGFFAIKKLGGWTYTAHRLHTLDAWPTYTQRLSQLEMLPIDVDDIVLLGDSHVAFGEWQDWLPERPIANRGIPGEGIEGLQAFAKTQELSKASLLVVEVGTNDLLFHDVEAVIDKYQALISDFEKINVPVVYCTLPGINNEVRWTGIATSDVAELNLFLLKQGGKGLNIIDLSSVFGTQKGVLPKGLTDDGVHLRGDGYRRWITEIDHYLNRVEKHN